MQILDSLPNSCHTDEMRTKSIDLAAIIRKAMKQDGRTVYAFARDSGLPVSGVQRFTKGGGMSLSSASHLCNILGLELRPIDGRAKRRH